MAINSNNRLDTLHANYTAMTGGGKGVALTKLGWIPAKCHLAIYDHYDEYRYKTGCDRLIGFGGKAVYTYTTRATFAKAFMNAWNSGRTFRVAYAPAEDKRGRDEFLWFAELMWRAADGNRRLDVLFEEVAKNTKTPGKEDSMYGECLTGGRKFGLVCHSSFQRATEVPNTVLASAEYTVVGKQQFYDDAKRMSKFIGMTPPEQIMDLQKLQYFTKVPGMSFREVGQVDLRHLFPDSLKPVPHPGSNN